jgi:dihydroorotate dehydrogenase electron transfer subunit
VTRNVSAVIVSNETIARGVNDMRLELSGEAADISPAPGQFAHVAVPGFFLRRPISVAGFEKNSGRVRLIVRVAGKGTEALTKKTAGELLDVLLPLGKPFPPAGAARKIWLVGGGAGVAPLIFAAERLAETEPQISLASFLGFRDEASSFGAGELKNFGSVAVNAGGFVTDEAKKKLETERPEMIFACGPEPMLAALQKIAAAANVRAFVSLEERMGCGVGACLVCNCRVKTDSPGGVKYRRVCKDGPVFDISEAVFR